MTTVRGTLRSTETRTADGHADDQPTARAEAVKGLNLAGFELLQVATVSSKASGDVVIRAIAQSTQTRDHEASGVDYRASMQAYRASIPDGWRTQSVRIVS